MAFKVFTAGSVLTAADLNDYLMEQANIVCDSGTRPTGQDGMRIKETDTGRELMHDGTNWVIMSEPSQTWTSPTMSGLTVGSGGAWVASYQRSNGRCKAEGSFTFGTGSAVTGALILTTPFSIISGGMLAATVTILDTGSADYGAIGRYWTSTEVIFGPIVTSSSYGSRATTSSSVPHSWASTDVLRFSIEFQMASRYS